jgi:hypothetical protein
VCIGYRDLTLQSLLTAPAATLTVSGRDYVDRPTHKVDRPTHEIGAELDCRGIPCVCFYTPVATTNGTLSLRLSRISDADETATTIPARDLQEGLKRIAWPRRRPLVRSDVELRPRTTHGSLGPKGRAAGGSSGAGVGPQLPRPAHGPQTQSGPAAGGASRGLRPGAGNVQSPMAQ